MPKPDGEFKGTLHGYYRWAFEQVREDQGLDSDAMNYIIGRWLERDREEALNEFQISRELYRNWKRGQGNDDTAS